MSFRQQSLNWGWINKVIDTKPGYKIDLIYKSRVFIYAILVFLQVLYILMVVWRGRVLTLASDTVCSSNFETLTHFPIFRELFWQNQIPVFRICHWKAFLKFSVQSKNRPMVKICLQKIRSSLRDFHVKKVTHLKGTFLFAVILK